MQLTRHFGKTLLALSLCVVAALFVQIQSTYAATYNYDGKSPVTTGCDNSGWAAKQKSFSSPNGVSGTVYLMFSSTCKTAWAFVRLNSSLKSGYVVDAFVHRNNDNKRMWCSSSNGNDAISPGQTTCYSAMVYDLNPNTSYAGVWVANSSTGYIYLTGSY